MVIGVNAWEFEIFGCQSLKQKRFVVKSLSVAILHLVNRIQVAGSSSRVTLITAKSARTPNIVVVEQLPTP